MTSENLQKIESFLVGATEAARLLGIGRSKFYEMNCTGQLGPAPVCLGSQCKRWSRDDLRTWVQVGCPSRERWLKLKEERAGKSD
jgi:predicted DNA-binding transcriptional regulator AlpA